MEVSEENKNKLTTQTAININDVILTEREAADFLKISLVTLKTWRLKADGRAPPYIAAFKSIRYLKSSLLVWAKENEYDI